MKKFFALTLVLIMLLSACSNEPVPEQSSESSQSEQESVSETLPESEAVLEPNESSGETVPKGDGAPCKYNTIPGYEVDTDEISYFTMGSRAVGGGIKLDNPDEVSEILSLLDKIVVYNTVESPEVFEDPSLGSWYSLTAVDKDGNNIFEWGLSPFSVIIRGGIEEVDNIPYKTDNGDEIFNEIFKIYDERYSKEWWAFGLNTQEAGFDEYGNLIRTELYSDEYPDIPDLPLYTSVYWEPIDGYEKTSPHRNQPETSYGFRYTDGKQVISHMGVVLSPEKDLVEYKNEWVSMSMFRGITETDKYEFYYEAMAGDGDWSYNQKLNGEVAESGYYGYLYVITLRLDEKTFLEFQYNFSHSKIINSYDEMPTEAKSELETIINSLYVE